jgi:hypothetical protein
MASNLTADDFAAVEAQLRSKYFLVHTQTLVLAVALLAAFGVGTVATAYAAAKAAATAEAEKVAKETVNSTTAKVVTHEIVTLRTTAGHETGGIAGLRKQAEGELEQIRTTHTEAGKVLAEIRGTQIKPFIDRMAEEDRMTSLLRGVWSSNKGKQVHILVIGGGHLMLVGEGGSLAMATFDPKKKEISVTPTKDWAATVATVKEETEGRATRINWDSGVVWSR